MSPISIKRKQTRSQWPIVAQLARPLPCVDMLWSNLKLSALLLFQVWQEQISINIDVSFRIIILYNVKSTISSYTF